MERFKKILFVVDAEKACLPALERAVALAANNEADLAVVAVIPRLHTGIHLFGDGATSDDLQAAAEAQQRLRLSSLIEPYGRRLRIRTDVLIGTPYLEIIREVLSEGHDLVIRPPDGAAWSGRLIGTDEMNLLRKCPCPVWLIKCGGSRSFRRILAAVDVGDSNRPGEETRHAMNCRIIEVASALARSERAELHVVYAWDAVGEAIMRGTTVNTPEKYVASYLRQVKERGAANLEALLGEVTEVAGPFTPDDPKLKTHLVRGSARKEIPALAKQLEIDLVVMGTVGRTGIPGLLMGNTAETILQQVDCSVLAVKPPGFVTPVTLDS
ncbi:MULTISPECIES: universal stress protein [unclassified Thiocapsa]|uniref:universal stress protein n=1 Tax=unclassified Thiocapsa TaxID=2641286 RepID=UPI0035AFA008